MHLFLFVFWLKGKSWIENNNRKFMHIIQWHSYSNTLFDQTNKNIRIRMAKIILSTNIFFFYIKEENSYKSKEVIINEICIIFFFLKKIISKYLSRTTIFTIFKHSNCVHVFELSWIELSRKKIEMRMENYYTSSA